MAVFQSQHARLTLSESTAVPHYITESLIFRNALVSAIKLLPNNTCGPGREKQTNKTQRKGEKKMSPFSFL